MRAGNQSTHLRQLQHPSGFKFVGGRLCLDFVNTVGGRTSEGGRKTPRDYANNVVRDKITAYHDLITWAELAAILSPAESRRLARRAVNRPKHAGVVLARSTALREALYRIFKSVVESWPPAARDLDVFRRELDISWRHERLTPAAPAFVWSWEDQPDSLDRVLWPVAKSAAELLTSTDLARVRQCGGDECGWMFLDTSRNRSRQWCDMRDCGNLAKVRRFRQRQTGAAQ